MVAGGPGDHPLTDILNYNLVVYGYPCDDLIKKIAKYISIKTMYEMFNWFEFETQSNRAGLEAILILKLTELENEAKLNGWEIDE